MTHGTTASRLSEQARRVEPFHVMRLLARAGELESLGRSIVHMEVGEPDFPTPPTILEAGRRALAEGRTRYSPAGGLPALRQDIATHYARRYGSQVDPGRILVTPGASGALQLVFLALVQSGDRVLICDPSYPCYRQVLQLMGVEPIAVPVGPDTDYQLTPALAAAAWVPGVRAIIVASPSNPTGSSIAPSVLGELHALCLERGAALIVDEVYQGLIYDVPDRTAIAIGSTDLYVINSFSKYFGMTGWRLGWLVGPRDAVEVMERLAQNLFIAANTPAQHAARAAFDPETTAILETRRLLFQQRRDRLLPILRDLGFGIPLQPTGAFYLYASLPERLDIDSMTFATCLLEEAGVALTPGRDFGRHAAEQHLRFAYTREIAHLEEGARRVGDWLASH
ncbi:MAG: aminotransferase class I/II-fold pyridoxal phosphate-dependent enzyme [Thiocapsa sp.]|jgi:aspartate/methionine/tyrosine aminotransferase|nr:aminotransferase class I/II-fold pyridoxal phosphate-dependent enzyme [Thiocapsa sp.]MCG6895935.1 aminotransferase class I/II-fold pyridoxal phosphate-dependent enzyme [Thiocapsa sp.]MCG6985843.1 aminotransferase class I/II-fold pyridoxal phosphate-dependent enzyme [Thiocapsa sp.]